MLWQQMRIVHAQIVETDLAHEFQALFNLRQDIGDDRFASAVQFQVAQPLEQAGRGQSKELRKRQRGAVLEIQIHVARKQIEAFALAGFAGLEEPLAVGIVLLVFIPDVSARAS